MSRRLRHQPLYHPPYAAAARQQPGTWIHVRTYDNPGVAAFVAGTIRNGTHPAYREGGYHAAVRPAGQQYALWISYQPQEP